VGGFNNAPGGFNFSLVWRSTLDSVQTSALSFSEFKLGSPDKKLSFQAELIGVTVSGATLNLGADIVNANIKYISFSIFIVTDAAA
jgi:hypothetical protein